MSRLRILVAHNVPLTRNSGMMRMMGFLHDEAVKQGHEVDYLTSDSLPQGISGRFGRLLFPWLVFTHARAAARQGAPYDIVNVHEPCGAWVVCLRRFCGNPKVVVTSHGVEQRGWEIRLSAPKVSGEYPGWRSRLGYPLMTLWQTRVSLRGADHVLCLSEDDKEFLVDRLGVSRERVTRVFPGVQPAYRESGANRRYDRFQRLLFAGTWLPRKGTNDLIAAFAEARRMLPGLELLVWGGGFDSRSIVDQFPADARASVHCLIGKGDKENAAAFDSADAFVLPSTFEGTPATLLEAMAVGLPVITTATCGMKDVIEHGVNGLLVKPRSPRELTEAIVRMAGDPALREKFGLSGRGLVESRFSWTEVARPVLRIYEELGGGNLQRATARGRAASSR